MEARGRGEQRPGGQGEGLRREVEGQSQGRWRGDAADKSKDAAGDAVDKAQELAAKADDKAIDLTQKDEGVVGAAAGAAHEVLDKVDGD